MQTLQIDLNKSPDIADAVADLEPGDELTLHGTIKALDDQTLTVTVEEVSVPRGDGDKPEMGNEGSDAAPVGSMMEATQSDDAQV